MRNLLLMVLIVIAISNNTAIAQAPPPVEVHIYKGNTLYMYDCYPEMPDPEQEYTMFVYVGREDGFVSPYGCTGELPTEIAPLPSYSRNQISAKMIK
jgi:hypothetical protein